MPEVGGVGAPPPADSQGRNRIGEGDPAPVSQQNAQAGGAGSATAGPPGALGQPTGLPAPLAPGQSALPDVLAGRDASQLVAAEQLRARGGASAVDELLGLNRQPTVMGALAAPPGNSEALRHMTPTMRRTVMRNLLDKQRERMRRLAGLARREREARGDGDDSSDRGRERGGPAALLGDGAATPDEALLERARLELGHAARMLELLDELMAMQDYTVSQMGSFSQG